MNRGVLTKAIREAYPALIGFGAGLFVIEMILARVLPQYLDQFATQLTQVPFFRNVVKALLGTDIGDRISPSALISIAWVHPVPLTMIWAHEIVLCTRMPAGEIDRGTADVYFALPFSRWQAYLSETAVWLVSGAILIVLAFAGNVIGSLGLPLERRPEFDRLVIVCLNLLGLYVAVGGIAYWVSAWSDRRGRAVGAVFGIVLASFFLGFIAEFWEPAEAVAFLGLLHYYRPLEVLTTGAWPWAHFLILGGAGAGAWLAGGWVLSRRDICTI